VTGQTSAAFYPAKQAAPRTARHLSAEKTGKFSPENLRDKMPSVAFYPAFQGSGFRLHCLRQPACGGPFQSGLGWWARTLQTSKVFLGDKACRRRNNFYL